MFDDYQQPRLRLLGLYQRTTPTIAGLQQIEITRDHFILHLVPTGTLAEEYSVEGKRIYVGSQPGRVRFTIEGSGMLSNQENLGMEGTYVKNVTE